MEGWGWRSEWVVEKGYDGGLYAMGKGHFKLMYKEKREGREAG